MENIRAAKAEVKHDSIRRGQVYSTKQLVACGISAETIGLWESDGLKFAQPRTKSKFYLGDQIIRFMFEE